MHDSKVTDRVILKDVAAAAGVARSTVSMALAGDRRIAQATRLTVQSVAQKLGYRPDPAMTALAAYRQGKRQTQLHAGLALIHNWGADLKRSTVWSAVVRAMQGEAERLGYYLDLMPVVPGKTDGPALTRTLRARSTAGVVFLPTRGPEPVPYEVDWSQFVLVGMEFGHPHTHIPHVIRDYFSACSEAYNRLRQAGYDRIGLLLSAGFKREGILPMLGGFTAQQILDPGEHAIPPLVNWNPDKPIQLQQWLRKHKPDAIIDWREETLENLRRIQSKTIPAFACALGTLEARKSTQAGIYHSAERLGTEAVRIAHRFLLAGNVGFTQHPLNVLLAGEWHDGESAPHKSELRRK